MIKILLIRMILRNLWGIIYINIRAERAIVIPIFTIIVSAPLELRVYGRTRNSFGDSIVTPIPSIAFQQAFFGCGIQGPWLSLIPARDLPVFIATLTRPFIIVSHFSPRPTAAALGRLFIIIIIVRPAVIRSALDLVRVSGEF
jgi:hypothetical protein